ncbi:GCD1 Nucleoside-diphosphate-sugar pyrophosphorylase involved in lipopolysaccharide biosynthesis/translation initiation factor 2B, gamma/epsilon subunits (eIF-2Bgamma/eIF-2Bepsilon) [Burkholderiaceae bacterium]
MSLLSSNKWKEATLAIHTSIEEAIANLDGAAIQIALIIGEDGRLVGTVTDGDIRRGLMKGLSLKEKINSVMNKEPLVVRKEISRDAVIKLMVENKIHQIPLVNDEYRLLGMYLWDEIFAIKKRDNVMVIMAGGRGIRLAPHTDNCPKPMLMVAGKPMLQHIIERAKLEGFNHFILAINYLGHMIKDYFSDGRTLGVKITYVQEEKSLGTAGALSLITPMPDAPILVTNGDVMTDINYGDVVDFHIHHEAQATMVVLSHELQHPFGVVDTDGLKILGFEEKPTIRTHINAGIYVLSPEVLHQMEFGVECDMPTLFEKVIEKSERAIVYPMHEPWMDVGRAEDLEKIRSGLHSSLE